MPPQSVLSVLDQLPLPLNSQLSTSTAHRLNAADQAVELVLCELIGYRMGLGLEVEGNIYHRREIL